MKELTNNLKNIANRLILGFINKTHLSRCIPDKMYIRMLYRRAFKKKPRLDNPQTYNEKLQWLKLYDHNPIYNKLVDKYEVKQWVADKIGEKYIIPTLGVWDRFENIEFEQLPNQFVLKCTHDSGGLVIVKDKNNFDIKAAKKKINGSLKNNYYWAGREWTYKDVKPRVIAEKYMSFGDNDSDGLVDYKFFSFNGEVKALMVATERNSGHVKFDFFDKDYKHYPFRWGHDHADSIPVKPDNYDEMVKIAVILSRDFPHVRVDLYNVKGNIYFGELTFYHWSGFCPFEPEEWDCTFGSWLSLPRLSTKK